MNFEISNVKILPCADDISSVQLHHFLKANSKDVHWFGFSICMTKHTKVFELVVLVADNSNLISLQVSFALILHQHIPWNSGWPAFLGASRSQSLSVWLRNAILRNCLPPFTFHVPTHTLSFLGLVNLKWF